MKLLNASTVEQNRIEYSVFQRLPWKSEKEERQHCGLAELRTMNG